jgi:hypothetical protein
MTYKTTIKQSKKRHGWQTKSSKHEIRMMYFSEPIFNQCVLALGNKVEDIHIVYEITYSDKPIDGWQVHCTITGEKAKDGEFYIADNGDKGIMYDHLFPNGMPEELYIKARESSAKVGNIEVVEF